MKLLSSSFSSYFFVPRLNVTSNMPRLNSKYIRQEFINFFIDKYDHTFIKSSPVVPFCDPSVPFVNAGMNQFKGVFLGRQEPPCLRAVNSQKCIRVGGKHNDLENVGSDDYHHTFFEMLGNWSFGDYFKEKACKMAWDLLIRGPYKINPEKLYVTYFGGDKNMGIEPDWETRDIWLDIGVPAERVLAFGSGDNFWEMGPSGPCGPCTEIHYDHEEGRKNASDRVNLGHEDLVEIWNLVFIEYNREQNGSLKKLPNVHVDTGMGLERLVAILQRKRSNYDTDLFVPIFEAIQKISHSPEYKATYGMLDKHYRILADHTRMVTVAIADGMFPDQNPKLRRVLRRAFGIVGSSFKNKSGLITELTNHVAESLTDAYPEIGAKLKQIQLIINHEEDIFKCLQKSVLVEWKSLISNCKDADSLDVAMLPGISGAFKELQKFKSSEKYSVKIPGDLSYKLYDTYGLDVNSIEVLCNYFQLQFNVNIFQNLLKEVRKQSRLSNNLQGDDKIIDTVIKYTREHNILPTDDSFKYFYKKEKDYVFPLINSKIQVIINDKQCVPEVSSENTCSIIFNKTNLYHDAGGQNSDCGILILKDGTRILIDKVQNIQGYILHNIKIPNDCKLSLGDEVTLQISTEKRLNSMRNHTATHLVNAALHKILTVTCQKSSYVSDTLLLFEFAVYGENFNDNEVKKVEELVRNVVERGKPIKRTTVDSQKLQELYISNQVTLVPGEVYPQDGIHIIEIVDPNLTSREACCGTHLFNTADIGDFCITVLKSPGSGTKSIFAVTGIAAANAIKNGTDVSSKVDNVVKCAFSLMDDKSTPLDKVETVKDELQKLKHTITNYGRHTLPFIIRVDSIEKIDEALKVLQKIERTFSRMSLEDEMISVLQSINSELNRPFLVHFLKCSSSMEDVPLQKATKMCTNLPVLLIACSDNHVKARCCVPKEHVSENFNAKIWMDPVISVFQAQGFVPRGQCEQEVFNMKKKYLKENANVLIDKAVTFATKLAKETLYEG